ncbi:MAG: hypothetical protein IKN38_03555, partial [Clostridia bacterium]|nr:hypothetical protein [Clostridia bacterium]
MVEAIRRLDEEGGVEHFYKEVGKGSVQLDFTVKQAFLERAETVMNTFTDGFLMLEEHYPECISVS